jgi:hypothetical protein
MRASATTAARSGQRGAARDMPSEVAVMRTRSCRALLGLMAEGEAMNFMETRCVAEGGTEERRAAWLEARARAAALPAAPATPTFRELPAAIDGDARVLLSSAAAAKLFAPGTAYQLVSVAGLMTFQFHVDSEYVDEVARETPAKGDWPATLAFCTRRSPLSEPFVDKAGVTFGSEHASNASFDPTLVARRLSDTEVEVCARVTSRPNYVLVYRYADGRAVLANGNHRVAALARAGHAEVPAVVQQVPPGASIHQMNVPTEGNFLERALLQSKRPPMVADYVDPAASTELRLRALSWVLRVGLQAIGFAAPR